MNTRMKVPWLTALSFCAVGCMMQATAASERER